MPYIAKPIVVRITGEITPVDPSDPYPTHRAVYAAGGYRSVDLLADLTNGFIPSLRREPGMLVFVIENSKTYRLGTDLVTWTEVTSALAIHTHPASAISDSTTAGRALVTAASATAQRTALGLGNSATLNVGTSAGTVAAGNDSRLSDARTPTSHTHPASAISDSTTAGRAVLTAADAPAQRTALGLGTAALSASTAFATAAQGIAADAAFNAGRVTIIGGADLSTKTGHFVTFNGSSQLVLPSAVTDRLLGVITTGAALGVASAVRLSHTGEVSPVMLSAGSAAVVAGDALTAYYTGVYAGQARKAAAGETIHAIATAAASPGSLVSAVIAGGGTAVPSPSATTYALWFGRTGLSYVADGSNRESITVPGAHVASVSRSSCAGSYNVPIRPVYPTSGYDKAYAYLALPKTTGGGSPTVLGSAWIPNAILVAGFEWAMEKEAPFNTPAGALFCLEFLDTVTSITWRIYRSKYETNGAITLVVS